MVEQMELNNTPCTLQSLKVKQEKHTKNWPHGPQETNWPLSWPAAALHPIRRYAIMSNRYLNIEANNQGVYWIKNRKNRPTGPQQIKWPICWHRTALNSINPNTLMPNMYVDLEDKFHGVLWKENKESVHLPPGDQIDSILPHSSPTSNLTLSIDAQEVCRHRG